MANVRFSADEWAAASAIESYEHDVASGTPCADPACMFVGGAEAAANPVTDGSRVGQGQHACPKTTLQAEAARAGSIARRTVYAGARSSRIADVARRLREERSK